MAINYTPEQQQVIDLRNRNILVSAAAGSGKTAVLVERIITMLTKDADSIDIDELLIVTFTEAAAAEMKERIQNAITAALEDDPENVHLQRQATLIHQAKITTIHGFCLSVIRDYFHTIDLDPGFRVAEEGELKLLKRDVVQELLEEKFTDGAAEFVDFVESYASGKNDSNLEEIILQLYEFSRSYPNPKAWFQNCISQYQVESEEALENKFFVKDMKAEMERCLSEWDADLDYALSVCLSEDGPLGYENNIRSDQAIVQKLQAAKTLREMYEVFAGAEWTKLATIRDKSVDPRKQALVKDIRNEVKDAVKKMGTQFLYDSVDHYQKDLLAAKNNMQVLVELVQSFADKFQEKKRSKNLIDFGDMERYALEILTKEEDGNYIPTSAAEELQDKLKEVMIDEYQDSNLIQEAILTSVSRISKGSHNIFMVGDVKQSIYRFRLSRPELFMEKFHTYSLTDSEKQRIDLHMNFRSRKEVLDSTNFVFEQIMGKNFGGINYDDKAALNLGATYEDLDDNDTEVILLEAGELKSKESKELEARAIAKRIKELVGCYRVLDKKTKSYRPAQYGDVVILTRSLAGWTDIFTEVLNEEGIPTYTNSKEGYFRTREIELVLDYLRVLDNPRQDIPLAATLVSVFGRVTNEELAMIRSATEESTLYEGVKAYFENGTDEGLCEKLGLFLNQLQRFRERMSYTAIHDLLWEILEQTGYRDYVAALPAGIQRAANLEMLLQKAIVFEKTSYKGLFNFIRYIEQLNKYDVDYGEANISDENMDVVNLMSIHKSKGLEFPIVFVAGMGKGFNKQDSKSSVVVHPELGVGLDHVDLQSRVKNQTLIKKIICRRIDLENAAEELRVLYVAMTRAKEKLILVGAAKKLEDKFLGYIKLEKRKEKLLPYSLLTEANSYWDWVLPALYRNKCMKGILEMYGMEAPIFHPFFEKQIPVQMKLVEEGDLLLSDIQELKIQEITKTVLDNWDTSCVYDEEMKEKIEEQFSYTYPFESDRKVKQKLSVSELKKRAYEEESGEEMFREEDVIPLLPKFLQEKTELTGALRGTAYHRVLELLDFAKTYSEKELEQEIELFQKKGLLEEEMAKCIVVNDVMTFLQSQAGQRMHKAAKASLLHAEQPFVLGISAEEVYGEGQKDETVLVQGIIDVYFEEDGELVVLDYKTDKVFQMQQLVERYRAQLEYYAQALERLTGKHVKEKIIYSFTLQKEIEV